MQREQYGRREHSGPRGYRPGDTGRLDYQQSGQTREEPDFRDTDRNYSDLNEAENQGDRAFYSDQWDRNIGSSNSNNGPARGQGGGLNDRDRSDRNDLDRQRGLGGRSDQDRDRYRGAPSDFTGRSQPGSWDRTTSSSNAGYRQSGNQDDWQSGIRGGRSSYNAGVDSMWSGGGRSFQEDSNQGYGRQSDSQNNFSQNNSSDPLQNSHRGKGPKGYQRSDERIHEDVSEHLTQHHEIDASNIEVKVQQGEVTLSGTVTDRNAKRMAEDVAESVSGVKEVTNQIRVAQNKAGSDKNGHAPNAGDTSSTAVQANRKSENETAAKR